MKFIDYGHNREEDISVSAKKIKAYIDSHISKNKLDILLRYFNKRYDLPEKVVLQKIKQHIARSYIPRKCSWKNRLNLIYLPLYIMLYGVFTLSLLFCKRESPKKVYKITLNGLESKRELTRFTNLIDLFGAENVFIIANNYNFKDDFPKLVGVNRKFFKGFLLKDNLKALFYEYFSGIWIASYLSFKLKINLLPVSLQIVHDYLKYNSIFKSISSLFLIQERHYFTDPIRNHLFKKYGGLNTATLQKNIFQFDPIYFYIDIDILFSLGETTYDDFLEFGGRVDKIFTVGSMFMESEFFKDSSKFTEVYDILFLGINT